MAVSLPTRLISPPPPRVRFLMPGQTVWIRPACVYFSDTLAAFVAADAPYNRTRPGYEQDDVVELRCTEAGLVLDVTAMTTPFVNSSLEFRQKESTFVASAYRPVVAIIDTPPPATTVEREWHPEGI